MNKSKSEQVNSFLSNLEMIESDRIETVNTIRKIFLNAFPNASEKIMYGGIVFFIETEMFGGVFLSKNHISIEFSRGYLMDDPKNHLEGKGKFRRHLKIRSPEDVASKEVAFFIKQSVE